MIWSLLTDTTLSDAKEHGAVWTRVNNKGTQEMFRLPPGYFKRWNAIPPPDVAHAAFVVMQYELGLSEVEA